MSRASYRPFYSDNNDENVGNVVQSQSLGTQLRDVHMIRQHGYVKTEVLSPQKKNRMSEETVLTTKRHVNSDTAAILRRLDAQDKKIDALELDKAEKGRQIDALILDKRDQGHQIQYLTNRVATHERAIWDLQHQVYETAQYAHHTHAQLAFWMAK